MKRRLLPLPIVFALLIAPLQTSDTAYACVCGSQTVEERVEGSDVVFVGSLVRFDGSSPVFAVERYYKGSGSAEISVTDPYPLGADCDYFPGRRPGGGSYLVFGYGVADGYATGLCAGNTPEGAPVYDAAVAEVVSITGPGQPPAGTPWAIILPLAFAIPLAVLSVPAFLRRRGGGH